MEKLTVNGRVYAAKEVDFNFLAELGNEKIDISDIDVKIIPAIRVYVAYCMGVDVERAGEEINAHVVNGGSIEEIASVLNKKAAESGFFRAINEQTETEEEQPATKESGKKKPETAE